MRTFVDIFTIVISIAFLFLSIKRIRNSSRYIIHIIFFIFYVFPIVLNYTIGFQHYIHQGFYISYDDILTCIVYDIGVVICQLILLFSFKHQKRKQTATNNTPAGKNYILLLFIVALAPTVLTVVLLGKPAMLYTFQWREYGLFSTAGSYAQIEKITYLGISCAIMILLHPEGKVILWPRLLSIVLIFFNVCIQGKRGIMFFTLLNVLINMFFIYMHIKGKIAKRIYVLTTSAVSLFFAVYMISMSINVKLERGYQEEDYDRLYNSVRVDFFRDDRVKLAIYSELYPEKMEMLDYYGQTFMSNPMYFFPLYYLIQPLNLNIHSYQEYLSYATAGHAHPTFTKASDSTSLNFMTPTIFAEFISNFGILLGFILYPLMCIWISSVVDRFRYPMNSFILCSFLLLNLFSFNYIALYLEFILLLCFIEKNRIREPLKICR